LLLCHVLLTCFFFVSLHFTNRAPKKAKK
jgi:hypothetical protein